MTSDMGTRTSVKLTANIHTIQMIKEIITPRVVGAWGSDGHSTVVDTIVLHLNVYLLPWHTTDVSFPLSLVATYLSLQRWRSGCDVTASRLVNDLRSYTHTH